MVIRFLSRWREPRHPSRWQRFRFDNGFRFHNEFSEQSQQGLSRRAESTSMTETPEHPTTPEQPGPADQEAELVPAAVLPQPGEAASAPEPTAPLDHPHPAVPAPAAPAAGPGWSLQQPPASLAPPSVPGAQQSPAAPQQPAAPQLPQPTAPPQPDYAGNPAPSWASPAASGLPPYGEGPAGLSTEPAPGKNSKTSRVLVTAAVVAALVGGGVGAAISYAVRGNSGNDVTSSTAINSNGLDTGSANATAVTAVAKKVLPSVVTITVAPSASNTNSSSGSEGDIGTGIILNSSGEILTNNHVISLAAGGGYTITVTFDGGSNAQASIVDRDPTSDLAVIKASGVSGLTPATLGDSTSVQVGQEVVAIGAPLGMSNTVTSGIVSALNRAVIPATDDSGSSSQSTTQTTSETALDAIQTDAAINPGNSGGPLIDMNGDVVGIDSAIASTGSDSLSGDSESGSIGLGFAIPISQAKPVIAELEAGKAPTHAVLGVSVQDSSPTAAHTGAVLATVSSGGAASAAGLKAGDEVTKIDDQEIDDSNSLEAAVHSYRPGTTVTVTYIRNGQTATASVTLQSASDSSS
jgi:putative serine protease PepD